MPKGLPYFKFFPTDWLTGDIVFEPLDVQGAFINICAIYWQRDGILYVGDIEKRFKQNDCWRSLINNFIHVEDEKISINFLDEQLNERGYISKINSENGRKGGKRKIATDCNSETTESKSSEGIAMAIESYPIRIRKEEETEEEKNQKKKKIEIPSKDDFLIYCQLILGDKYLGLEFSLISKYEAWKGNDWKDGYDKKIKNWKSKIKNTIPFLKSDNQNGIKQGQTNYHSNKADVTELVKQTRAMLNGNQGNNYGRGD